MNPFKQYVRFIRWNGRQMANHPVRWLVGVVVYNAVVLAVYLKLMDRAEKTIQPHPKSARQQWRDSLGTGIDWDAFDAEVADTNL